MRIIATIENTINLLKNIPKEVLGKINIAPSFASDTDEDIEVVVLYGEQVEKVKALVESLDGTLQDLGYGFGIISLKPSKIISLAESTYIQYIEFPLSLIHISEPTRLLRISY